jgi:hypothetical protein
MVTMVSLLFGSVPLTELVVAQETTGLASYAPIGALVYGEVELDPGSGQVTMAHELLDRANLEALLSPDQQHELDESLAMAEGMIDGQAAFFFGPIDPGDLGMDDVSREAAAIANDPLAATQDLPSGWAILLQPSDPQAIHEFLLDSIGSPVAMAVEDPADESSATPDVSATDVSVQTETYEGYAISYIPGSANTEGQALALVDEVVVVATTTDDIKTVIDVVTGSTEPLADDANFQEVRSQLPEQTLAMGYVNGPAWIDLIESQDAAEFEQIPDDLLASFAVHQGFAVWADEPGFRLESVALVPDGTERLAPTGYQPTFADVVPGNTMVFAGGMDLGAQPQLEALAFVFALELIGVDSESATPPADPEAYAEEVFAEAEGVLGFNLKTDVLDQLTGEWAVAGTTDLATASAVFMTEVDDPDVVANVVADITALLASQSGADASLELSTRDVDGTEVTVVEITDSAIPMVIEFGVVDGKLVVGLNGWLDLATTPAEDPLSGDSTFQATLAALPVAYTSLTYINIQSVLPLAELATTSFATSSTEDADPACGEYAFQAEAQAAYDEDDFENYMLDLDWDGEACEDYFAPATPVATPVGVAEVNILSLGAVTWIDDGISGTSAIVLIRE